MIAVRRASLPALVVALLLSPPLAAASWGGGPGSVEPNTPQDLQGPWMFTTPPTGSDQVYFDAFATVDQLTLNPNSGTLGGRMLPVGPTTFRAFVGVWADCNEDGYIGSAEGALQDYSSALVKDLKACPVGGPHNDGQWASELLMLGMVDPCEFQNATYRAQSCPTSNYDPTTTSVPAFFEDTRVLYAHHARVWGDAGRPGEASTHCPLVPLADGTTSGTGAALRSVDCFDGYAVAKRVDETDPSGKLGLGFGDPSEPQRSNSTLNQQLPVNLFGNPTTGKAGLLQRNSGDSSANVWDCSSPQAVRVRDPDGLVNGVAVTDPTGGALSGPQVIPVAGTQVVFDNSGNPSQAGVFRPLPDDAAGDAYWGPGLKPSLHDPTGSWWDAAVAAADGPRGDCDPSTENAVGQRYVGNLVEGAQSPGVPGQKAREDFVFSFYDGYRGIDSHVDPTLHSQDFPSDGGLVYMRNQYGGPIWSAEEPAIERPALVRADDLSAEGASWFTFYADFDTSGLSLPSFGVGAYGEDACGGSIGPNAPDANGWACDPNLWWRDDRGQDAMPRYSDGYGLAAMPGDEFLLRDVDCYDGTPASAAPVGVGLASLSAEGNCPRI